MLYRNTPRFQYVLQAALELHAQDKGYSDQKMIDDANLRCSKSTLNRFRGADLNPRLNKVRRDNIDRQIDRVAGSYLNSQDADILWRYLDAAGYIEKAMTIKGVSKKELYPLSEVANALHCFYAVHRSSNLSFTQSGIEGRFFCYKPSFRRPGFTVKSLISLTNIEDDYFSVHEKQCTSGLFEMDKAKIIEESEGFGFIKSGRIWLFLRDVESEQPRIFCFHKPKFSHIERDSKIELSVNHRKISSINGYLLEGAKGNENSAFKHNVVLISEQVERRFWLEEFPDAPFVAEDNIEVFPTETNQLDRYRDLALTRRIIIPREVTEYLNSK